MEWGIWLPIKRLKIWRNRSNFMLTRDDQAKRKTSHRVNSSQANLRRVIFRSNPFSRYPREFGQNQSRAANVIAWTSHAPFILPTQKQIMKNARVSLKFHLMERRLVKDEFWRPFLARWTSLSFCNGKTTPKRTFNSRMFITWIHVGFENLLHSTFKASAKGERGKEDAKSEKKRFRHPTEKG